MDCNTDFQASAIESVLVGGDLSQLSEADRIAYYLRVCQSLGLNHYTQPFSYIKLQGRLTLYAKRDCCEQLRKLHGISIKVLRRETDLELQLHSVECEAVDKYERKDNNIGIVSIAGLRGDQLANALMRAHTKSVRRVTLSLSGLGFLDESEVESISRRPVELPQFIKKPEEVWNAWRSPEDAIEWAATKLPGIPVSILWQMFDECPSINGKKAVAWAERVLELAAF